MPFLCRRIVLFLLTALLPLCGCAHTEAPIGPVDSGYQALAPVRVESWTYNGGPARRVITPHYVVYATVTNDDFLEAMGQLMEGALAEYRRLAPDVAQSDRPMECYLFASRPEWAQFTRARTGDDAAIYLQINRGGYTVRDWYVAYFLGDSGTFCVASHEGFHQFAARHFKTRIPPFLEEGIACLFEDVSWDGRLPRWDLSVNYGRQSALRKAIDKGLLLPLDQLAAMHAGQIISRSPDQIAGFYAQCWAFARFLWEFDGGRYRTAMQSMLADAGEGTLFGASSNRLSNGLFWNPRSAKPLLEHYLGANLGHIDVQFKEYMLLLARPPAEISGG